MKMQEKIDFVVLWVDGSDRDWLAKKASYQPDRTADVSAVRYRDWDMFRYWFRSVEKYAPWVNRIHLVTDDQIPSWLNCTHPKLHLVSHRDFIPEEDLPLFNSSAIEIGIGAIPELSDHFVYFNDDVFLNAPITSEYYFRCGVPVDMAGLTRRSEVKTTFACIVQNDNRLINKYFDKKTVIRENFFKWFRPTYGKTFLRTLLYCRGKEFRGFVIPHMSIAYRKSDLSRVWEKESELLADTQTHHFRCETDLSHFVYRFWRLCEGDFYPQKNRGYYISLHDRRSAERAAALIRGGRVPEFCLNDNWEKDDFQAAKELLTRAFEEKLPEKSSFEI